MIWNAISYFLNLERNLYALVWPYIWVAPRGWEVLSQISGIKKKRNGKMVVTFLKLNIFLLCFFLTTSTFSETSKNEVYSLKTNFWGTLPPIQNKNIFGENLKKCKMFKFWLDGVRSLWRSFSGVGMSCNVQKWDRFAENPSLRHKPSR